MKTEALLIEFANTVNDIAKLCVSQHHKIQRLENDISELKDKLEGLLLREQLGTIGVKLFN